MNEDTRTPLTIDVEIDKDARIVQLTMKEDGKQVRLVLSSVEATLLGRRLREAVHKMGKKVSAK